MHSCILNFCRFYLSVSLPFIHLLICFNFVPETSLCRLFPSTDYPTWVNGRHHFLRNRHLGSLRSVGWRSLQILFSHVAVSGVAAAGRGEERKCRLRFDLCDRQTISFSWAGVFTFGMESLGQVGLCYIVCCDSKNISVDMPATSHAGKRSVHFAIPPTALLLQYVLPVAFYFP